MKMILLIFFDLILLKVIVCCNPLELKVNAQCLIGKDKNCHMMKVTMMDCPSMRIAMKKIEKKTRHTSIHKRNCCPSKLNRVLWIELWRDQKNSMSKRTKSTCVRRRKRNEREEKETRRRKERRNMKKRITN
uniref:Uncharacterized protein n=1 Tax=Cacopsylla melanoneura TaxID=428564 RepID=A0A8D9F6U1_9HEMI